ncbi:MAG: hypothetical protein Q7T03_08215 [Deltaproteobacteria bacterium]|nr:hypothetical protein [Deltaproteobacteria bacterium]
MIIPNAPLQSLSYFSGSALASVGAPLDGSYTVVSIGLDNGVSVEELTPPVDPRDFSSNNRLYKLRGERDMLLVPGRRLWIYGANRFRSTLIPEDSQAMLVVSGNREVMLKHPTRQEPSSDSVSDPRSIFIREYDRKVADYFFRFVSDSPDETGVPICLNFPIYRIREGIDAVLRAVFLDQMSDASIARYFGHYLLLSPNLMVAIDNGQNDVFADPENPNVTISFMGDSASVIRILETGLHILGGSLEDIRGLVYQDIEFHPLPIIGSMSRDLLFGDQRIVTGASLLYPTSYTRAVDEPEIQHTMSFANVMMRIPFGQRAAAFSLFKELFQKLT